MLCFDAFPVCFSFHAAFLNCANLNFVSLSTSRVVMRSHCDEYRDFVLHKDPLHLFSILYHYSPHNSWNLFLLLLFFKCSNLVRNGGGAMSHRADQRRLFAPLCGVARTVCGCWSMPAPTRRPGTACVLTCCLFDVISFYVVIVLFHWHYFLLISFISRKL